MYTHSGKSTSVQQKKNLKVMQLFKYKLPRQPNHQKFSDFTKKAYYIPERMKLIIYAHFM